MVGIECDSFVRLASIGSAGKAVKDGVHPAIRCGAELKNCATSKISSKHRRAVDVACAVRLQVGIGVFALVFLKS
jgi:hypothetical protein